VRKADITKPQRLSNKATMLFEIDLRVAARLLYPAISAM
jgi:hypothetical protein